MALLEAIAGEDRAEVFRRAVEKDLSDVAARAQRLAAELALAPDVVGPILADALDSVERVFLARKLSELQKSERALRFMRRS